MSKRRNNARANAAAESEDKELKEMHKPQEPEQESTASQSSEDDTYEAKNSSTSSSEVVKITLEEYLRKVKVNPGLLASFKVEARAVPGALEPKTKEEWAEAFQLQSRRVYQ